MNSINASPHFSQITRGWAKSVAEVADESVCKASQENRGRFRHVEGIIPPPAYVRRGLETSRKRTPARRPRSSYLRNDAALIKYVAAYRVAPVQAITHIAPVKSIEPWKDSGKSVINFTEPSERNLVYPDEQDWASEDLPESAVHFPRQARICKIAG